MFPSLNMAVKRREQTLQDYKRLQSKVEKYEEKERTGPVLAKLHQVPGCCRSQHTGRDTGKTREELLVLDIPAMPAGSKTLRRDVFYWCKNPSNRVLEERNVDSSPSGRERASFPN